MSDPRSDATSKRIRVFVAAWPTESYLDALAPLDRWLKRAATHRVIPREQRHVTIAFLGDIDLSLLAPLTASLQRAAASLCSFETDTVGVTGFPAPDKPRIVAIELKESAQLHACFENMLRAVAEIAPVDTVVRDLDRRRTPHLTLGRTRNTRNARRLDLSRAPQIEARMEFAAIRIVQSRLTNAGPEYKTLVEIPFGRQNL